MGAQSVSIVAEAQEFFKEKVTDALSRRKVQVDDHIEFYLVNLLCDFVSPQKLETGGGEIDPLDTPLALMYKQAVEAPPSQRTRIFKRLGDTSLYVAGFFQDFFNRKTFDIGYYINLGKTAYGSVSMLMRDQHHDDHFTTLYERLAWQFNELVDVVAEVSETPEQRKSRDILAIYDRWTRSNSDRLREILQEHGITPIPVKPTAQ